jgi:hypothetical protein
MIVEAIALSVAVVACYGMRLYASFVDRAWSSRLAAAHDDAARAAAAAVESRAETQLQIAALRSDLGTLRAELSGAQKALNAYALGR